MTTISTCRLISAILFADIDSSWAWGSYNSVLAVSLNRTLNALAADKSSHFKRYAGLPRLIQSINAYLERPGGVTKFNASICPSHPHEANFEIVHDGISNRINLVPLTTGIQKIMRVQNSSEIIMGLLVPSIEVVTYELQARRSSLTPPNTSAIHREFRERTLNMHREIPFVYRIHSTATTASFKDQLDRLPRIEVQQNPITIVMRFDVKNCRSLDDVYFNATLFAEVTALHATARIQIVRKRQSPPFHRRRHRTPSPCFLRRHRASLPRAHRVTLPHGADKRQKRDSSRRVRCGNQQHKYDCQ
jgi:hypothetical protein